MECKLLCDSNDIWPHSVTCEDVVQIFMGKWGIESFWPNLITGFLLPKICLPAELCDINERDSTFGAHWHGATWITVHCVRDSSGELGVSIHVCVGGWSIAQPPITALIGQSPQNIVHQDRSWRVPNGLMNTSPAAGSNLPLDSYADVAVIRGSRSSVHWVHNPPAESIASVKQCGH